MKLTELQKRFADHYIETGNATESYLKAGYKVRTNGAARANASRLLTNANVKAYVEEKLKELEDKRIAKAEEVLQYLTSAMRGEIKEEVVVVENIGDFASEARIVEKQIGAKERLKAAELLGKRYLLFTDKVEHSGEIAERVVFIDDLGDDDEENEED